jgi:predicted nucleic acid-binding protein
VKERFFIDSSFFFSLVDQKNLAHEQSKELLQKLPPFYITSNYVFAETLSLITKRLGKQTGVLFARSLQSSQQIDLIVADSKQEKQALEMYEKYDDKDFDYIDAISFILCKAFSIRRVLTFDHHFAQMGFVLVTPDL